MRKKVFHFLDNFELHAMVFLMLLFIANISLQIFTRVIFRYALFFTEEISRYAFLWMVFLGMSYATLHDRHIRISFIVEKLPNVVQRIIEISLHLLTIAVFCWVFSTSIEFLRFSYRIVSPALQVSKAVYASILPFSSALMIIRSLQKVAQIISRMRNSPSEQPGENTAEGKS